jgi:hypothetical protein
MSFKLQIVQEIERQQLTVKNPQRLMVFKIDQLLLNGLENSVTLIGNQTPLLCQSRCRTKDNRSQSKTLEKQKSGTTGLVMIKKSNHFDMMIDIAEEYKIDIRKTPTRTIDHFKQEEQQTIMFACNLFGIDRQVYYRRIKRKINKEAKSN